MENPVVVRESLERAARALARSGHVIALVGSKARHPDAHASTYGRFLESPQAWWRRWLDRAEELATTAVLQPTPAQQAIARMERSGFLQHLITHDTHEAHQAAGGLAVTELHGSAAKLRCIQCGSRYGSGEVSLDELPPRCPACLGWIKPDALLPGEALPSAALTACKLQTARCDAMLLVEADGLTYPEASFPLAAAKRGAWLIEINPSETTLSSHCDLVIRDRADLILPRLLQRVTTLREAPGTALDR